MNILLIAAGPGRVGIFATADSTGLQAEIGAVVQIDKHYVIPCLRAHEVEKHVRQKLSSRALGMDATWYAISFDVAVAAVALALQTLGIDELVVRGTIKPHYKLVPA